MQNEWVKEKKEKTDGDGRLPENMIERETNKMGERKEELGPISGCLIPTAKRRAHNKSRQKVN